MGPDSEVNVIAVYGTATVGRGSAAVVELSRMAWTRGGHHA